MARTRRTVSVLLLEDTEYLGEVGDVVDVKPGYARNYLLPAGIATVVTTEALRRVERTKTDAAAQRAARAVEIAEFAKSLEGMSLMLEHRASEEGHLFGAVHAVTIVEALAAQGVKLDEKQIVLDVPIKELGIFSVPVQLDADSRVEIRVWVVETES